MTYERTATIRARVDDAPGAVEGTLATNGEASDGHIIDLSGMRAEPGAPLLWGHDAYSGLGNLGSWTGFRLNGPKPMKSLGDQQLSGVAQIEMGGAGMGGDFRQDLAHMVAEGHIRQFSVRWDIDGEPPVRRVNLSRDHPAYVDETKAKGAQRYGLFFPRSRLLEGSIVTIGADANAVMRHLEEIEDPALLFWWTMEKGLDASTMRQMMRMRLELPEEQREPFSLGELRIQDTSPEPELSLVEEPEPASEEPVETPEPAVVPAPLAERALEQLRSAYPEFVQEAPEMVQSLVAEVFGTFDSELRQKLDEYAYRKLGRVPAQRT